MTDKLTQTGSQASQELSRSLCQEQINKQGCHKCINSKMNGMNLICTEWQEVIEDDECLCSCYEEECDE